METAVANGASVADLTSNLQESLDRSSSRSAPSPRGGAAQRGCAESGRGPHHAASLKKAVRGGYLPGRAMSMTDGALVPLAVQLQHNDAATPFIVSNVRGARNPTAAPVITYNSAAGAFEQKNAAHMAQDNPVRSEGKDDQLQGDAPPAAAVSARDDADATDGDDDMAPHAEVDGLSDGGAAEAMARDTAAEDLPTEAELEDSAFNLAHGQCIEARRHNNDWVAQMECRDISGAHRRYIPSAPIGGDSHRAPDTPGHRQPVADSFGTRALSAKQQRNQRRRQLRAERNTAARTGAPPGTNARTPPAKRTKRTREAALAAVRTGAAKLQATASGGRRREVVVLTAVPPSPPSASDPIAEFKRAAAKNRGKQPRPMRWRLLPTLPAAASTTTSAVGGGASTVGTQLDVTLFARNDAALRVADATGDDVRLSDLAGARHHGALVASLTRPTPTFARQDAAARQFIAKLLRPLGPAESTAERQAREQLVLAMQVTRLDVFAFDHAAPTENPAQPTIPQLFGVCPPEPRVFPAANLRRLTVAERKLAAHQNLLVRITLSSAPLCERLHAALATAAEPHATRGTILSASRTPSSWFHFSCRMSAADAGYGDVETVHRTLAMRGFPRSECIVANERDMFQPGNTALPYAVEVYARDGLQYSLVRPEFLAPGVQARVSMAPASHCSKCLDISTSTPSCTACHSAGGAIVGAFCFNCGQRKTDKRHFLSGACTSQAAAGFCGLCCGAHHTKRCANPQWVELHELLSVPGGSRSPGADSARPTAPPRPNGPRERTPPVPSQAARSYAQAAAGVPVAAALFSPTAQTAQPTQRAIAQSASPPAPLAPATPAADIVTALAGLQQQMQQSLLAMQQAQQAMQQTLQQEGARTTAAIVALQAAQAGLCERLGRLEATTVTPAAPSTATPASAMDAPAAAGTKSPLRTTPASKRSAHGATASTRRSREQRPAAAASVGNATLSPSQRREIMRDIARYFIEGSRSSPKGRTKSVRTAAKKAADADDAAATNLTDAFDGAATDASTANATAAESDAMATDDEKQTRPRKQQYAHLRRLEQTPRQTQQ
jgi:hypothetical protein